MINLCKFLRFPPLEGSPLKNSPLLPRRLFKKLWCHCIILALRSNTFRPSGLSLLRLDSFFWNVHLLTIAFASSSPDGALACQPSPHRLFLFNDFAPARRTPLQISPFPPKSLTTTVFWIIFFFPGADFHGKPFFLHHINDSFFSPPATTLYSFSDPFFSSSYSWWKQFLKKENTVLFGDSTSPSTELHSLHTTFPFFGNLFESLSRSGRKV